MTACAGVLVEVEVDELPGLLHAASSSAPAASIIDRFVIAVSLPDAPVRGFWPRGPTSYGVPLGNQGWGLMYWSGCLLDTRPQGFSHPGITQRSTIQWSIHGR